MFKKDFSPQKAPILVATDAVADADLVMSLLSEEFGNVRTSTKPECSISDFEEHRPSVLVLAFDSLETANQYYLGIHRHSRDAHLVPHRTLVLCSKHDLWRAYELCKKEQFDDYVLFWPVTNDAPRLRMAVHHALRRLNATLHNEVTANQLANQVRPLAALEPELVQLISSIGQQIEVAAATFRQAEEACAGTAGEPRPNEGQASNNRAPGNPEVTDLDNLTTHLGAMADAVTALRSLVTRAGHEMSASLAPVKALLDLSHRVRPIVLMVDDDAFQHKLVARALADYRIELIYAHSGSEVMGLLWQHRPNLVLMDIGLPDVDGIQMTRRIRDIANFADIQIVMLTGHSERSVVLESLRAGAVDFLVKPLEKAKLVEKLASFGPMTPST
ncbi:response regulator protein [Caballeronia choica]|uniref:Response regulator protein n=1 Tax=Caballeronia choica TaxID=326476 RepID=A0A158ITJ8_9BURK|nr:response regulator [Caballeronia choica]SAL59815.1 response regulator protein [Caballeronia choica]